MCCKTVSVTGGRDETLTNGRKNKKKKERKLEEFRSFRTSKRLKRRKQRIDEEEEIKTQNSFMCVKKLK